METTNSQMRRDINRALDFFHLGRNEDDTKWVDLVKAVKQVADCRRQEEEECQTREVQMFIEEIIKLKAMVTK